LILVVLYLKGDPPIVKGILNASRGELAIPAAAGIRVELEKRGLTIGPLDMLIAGTAVSRGAALVTNNAAEFSRVPGLRVLDWRSA
jgi:predicted nucleic acid-binding protein